MKFQGNTLDELRAQIRQTPTPAEQPARNEFASLASLTYSRFFADLFQSDGPFSLEAVEEDPPDFVALSGDTRVSLEVVRITTGMYEMFKRSKLSLGEGSFTSTLRSKHPDKEFREQLESGRLPDHSEVLPLFEKVYDLEADHLSQASAVLTDKIARLQDYGQLYSRRFLLVRDELSLGGVPDHLMTQLRDIVRAQAVTIRFDGILIVDGNCYDSAWSGKL